MNGHGAASTKGSPTGVAGSTRRIEHQPDREAVDITFPYHADLVGLVRQIPGARWDPDERVWRVPLSLAATDGLRTLFVEHGFEAAAGFGDELDRREERARENAAASAATAADLNIAGLGGELRPFQKAGVAYAARNRRVFIADEMGLGKTAQALATVHTVAAWPALVVCPASVALSWRREAGKWLPGRPIIMLNGAFTPLGRDRARDRTVEHALLIASYESLKGHVALDERQPAQWLQTLGLKALILDESQYVKNPKAQRTKLCRALARNVDVRLLLTGTPVLNRPEELLSQLAILGRLEELGGYRWFIRRYCDAVETRFGIDKSGAANLGELHQRLRTVCYVRRTKREVLKQLPAKQRSTIPLEIDNRNEYDRAERDLIAWLRDQVERDRAFMAEIAALPDDKRRQLIRERQITVEARARARERLVRITKLKQLAARGKLAAAKEWIASFLASDQKLVIFAHRREIVAAIAHSLGGAPVITGDTPLSARQAAVDRFQTEPECRAIVCNIQAAGVGLTLTAASNVVFLELGWTPAAHDQAEDRCHRIGQQDQVTGWYLLGAGTIDEDIAALIDDKRGVIEAVTNGSAPDVESTILGALVERLTNPAQPTGPDSENARAGASPPRGARREPRR